MCRNSIIRYKTITIYDCELPHQLALVALMFMLARMEDAKCQDVIKTGMAPRSTKCIVASSLAINAFQWLRQHSRIVSLQRGTTCIPGNNPNRVPISKVIVNGGKDVNADEER